MSHGFMLVYSITSRSSFVETPIFRNQILRLKQQDYFPMILVGNHCEREADREVSSQEGEALARIFACAFREISIVDRPKIVEAYVTLIRDIRKYEEEKAYQETTIHDLDSEVGAELPVNGLSFAEARTRLGFF